MPTLRPNPALARALRQTGAPASREENDALLPRVRAKDPAAVRRMIEGNLPLVIRKCREFVRNRPALSHLADDMTAAGFVALIEAVHKLANAEPGDNVTGYLSTTINGAFRSFCDSPVSCPARSRWRIHARGGQLPQSVEDSAEPFYDPRHYHELVEEIAVCCRPDTADALIVQLRLAGFVDSEIAPVVGMSPHGVFYARRAIERRFNARQLA